MQNLNIFKTARSITLAPVSCHDDKSSRLNYERERTHESKGKGYSAMWDDSVTNETQVNDLFAFIEDHGRKESDVGEGRCQVRRVISVLDPDARPSYWKRDNRNVLVLGEILYEGTWVELRKICGKAPWGKIVYKGTPDESRVTPPLNANQRWVL